jgi:hypothetical protein
MFAPHLSFEAWPDVGQERPMITASPPTNIRRRLQERGQGRSLDPARLQLHFPRFGASECDVMFNVVPEAATADSQVFFSHGCFTNMLDYGAEHFKLRRLDMPRNFFGGNNCVAEYGNFPSNFLLGVSTPGNDIQFRRQMRSRLGEPVTGGSREFHPTVDGMSYWLRDNRDPANSAPTGTR